MQLHHIQAVTIHLPHDVIIRRIDKDPDLAQSQLRLFHLFTRQMPDDIPGGFGIEDKSRKIYTHCVQLFDLIDLGHSAYFYSHKL